ncbi:MAG: hypothetical protein ACFFFK_10425 [Candidatus Thorarchaeota archaeon]
MEIIRPRVSIVLIGILFILLLSSHQTIPADADVANIIDLHTGETFSNSSSLTMPQADVRIRILSTLNDGIHVNVSGKYHIVSDVTQNVSLAFVYPKYWTATASGPNISLSVYVNGSSMSYAIVPWENLNASGFEANSTYFGGTWIENTDFVLFTCSMIADDLNIVTVEYRAFPLDYGYAFYFHYIVGTARTFEAETHETIEMHVVEDKPFLNKTFEPEDFLTVSTNSTGTTAEWDFQIDSNFEINTIHFYGRTNEYNPWRPTPDLSSALIAIGVGVTIIVVVMIFLSRKH